MFKVDDKVWSIEYGFGVVETIDKNLMLVGVRYDDNSQNLVWYDTLGKRDVYGYRTLFFEEVPVPKSALERPRKSAKEMLEGCKEVEFKHGEENFYICYSHNLKTVYISCSAFTECLGIKYISEEDADKIVRECKENNN